MFYGYFLGPRPIENDLSPMWSWYGGNRDVRLRLEIRFIFMQSKDDTFISTSPWKQQNSKTLFEKLEAYLSHNKIDNAGRQSAMYKTDCVK